jgi:hypothetical protein
MKFDEFDRNFWNCCNLN